MLRLFFGAKLLAAASAMGIKGWVIFLICFAVLCIPAAIVVGVYLLVTWRWDRNNELSEMFGVSLYYGLLTLISPFGLGLMFFIAFGVLKNCWFIEPWVSGLHGQAAGAAIVATMGILSAPVVLSLTLITVSNGLAFWKQPRDYESPLQNRMILFLKLISPISLGLIAIILLFISVCITRIS